MACWMNLGQNLKINARKYPDTVALKDSSRSFTYPDLNFRVNQLANSLLSLGLTKGSKVAVLMENSVEIIEIYLATAKTGMIIIPINFRLIDKEIAYILANSDADALIVHEEFTPVIQEIREGIKHIPDENYIVAGNGISGFRQYDVKGTCRRNP